MMQNNGTYEYQYFLKDHLGNTRISLSQNGTVLQEDAYYPFGMNIAGLSAANSSPENKYKYNGKRCTERSRSELEDEFGLNWYDYGARFYDPAIARWHVVDPLAEAEFGFSEYSYVLNTPILLIDPDGMKWINPYEEYLEANKDNMSEEEIKSYKVLAGRSNRVMKDLKEGDETLFNYIENLTLTGYDGNSYDVNISVFVADGIKGKDNQVGQTEFKRTGDGKSVNADYGLKKVNVPIAYDKLNEKFKVGFNITVWDGVSFRDNRLANECGDVMFYMEKNIAALNDKSNAEHFREKGGLDKYLNSPSGKYSTKVESIYKERKNGKTNVNYPY